MSLCCTDVNKAQHECIQAMQTKLGQSRLCSGHVLLYFYRCHIFLWVFSSCCISVYTSCQDCWVLYFLVLIVDSSCTLCLYSSMEMNQIKVLISHQDCTDSSTSNICYIMRGFIVCALHQEKEMVRLCSMLGRT